MAHRHDGGGHGHKGGGGGDMSVLGKFVGWLFLLVLGLFVIQSGCSFLEHLFS